MSNFICQKKTYDLDNFYQEFKHQVLQKTSFQQTQMARKDMFLEANENFSQRLFASEMFQVSSLRCFQYQFKQHDNINMFFNQFQKQLEIKMHDIEKPDVKGSQILIIIPYNEQMSLQVDQKKLFFLIRTFHLKIYKNNQSKKGISWEKINVLNYKMFEQLDKKQNNFQFEAVLAENEALKFQQLKN